MILRRICRLMLTRITQQVSRVFEFTQKEWYKVMKEEKLCDRSGAYIAPNATVIGAVSMGKDSSLWYQAVARGDHDSITIGEGSNIQDGCILHADAGFPVVIGDHVTVGHAAIIHGCEIGDGALIGMGSIVLNGAKIGKNAIIGAGALVTQGTVIPDGMLAVGSPAKVRREVTVEEIKQNHKDALDYIETARAQFGDVQ